MKKLFLLFISLVLLSKITSSQSWQGVLGKLYSNPTTTKVGIGLLNPQSKLDVKGDIHANSMKITSDQTYDWTYDFQIKTNNSFTKAIGIIDQNNEDLFLIWGNGIVNAKKIYAEALHVKPDAMQTYWYDYVFCSRI